MALPELELHSYHRYEDPAEPYRGPRVRLPRMVARFVRVAELLRWLDSHDRGNPYSVMVAGELARRGVLDRVHHFERYKGAIRLTDEARAMIHEAKAYLEDWGLAEESGNGTIRITRDGRETLADWDDPSSECIYGAGR